MRCFATQVANTVWEANNWETLPTMVAHVFDNSRNLFFPFDERL
jgi:hypothetical protein